MRGRVPRFVRSNGNLIAASGSVQSVYGPGLDGALVFDGTATVTIAGGTIAPAAGVYTIPRDLLPTTMRIDTGVRVKLAGSAIFGSVSALIDGILDDDGANAVLGVAGAARVARRYGLGAAGGSAGVGGSAVTNAPPGIFPTVAAAAAAAASVPGTIGQSRGAGGSGGGGSVGASGTGGAITQMTDASSAGAIDFATIVRGRSQNNGTQFAFGSGGGSGGTGAGTRGAGGAGAGLACVTFPIITGSGRISARGGAGGNATAAGAAGGGGGGGGGIVVVVYDTIGSVSVSVAGGAGGSGDGSGAAGGAGAAGYLWDLPAR